MEKPESKMGANIQVIFLLRNNYHEIPKGEKKETTEIKICAEGANDAATECEQCSQ